MESRMQSVSSLGPAGQASSPASRGDRPRRRVLMTSHSAKRSLIGLGLALAAGLVSAVPSSADGPCGQNFDGPHACAVNSPGTYGGSLSTDNESDYYVLSALPGTAFSVSITDTESPGCSTSYVGGCGSARVALLDGNGTDLYEGAFSQPTNGVTVPGTFSHTLDGGNYYLVVAGNLGTDRNSNPTSTPYALSVNASPAVQWPPPPPPPPHGTYKVRRCRMKRIRRHHHRVRVRVCRTVTVRY
jgi:hypothetical protein